MVSSGACAEIEGTLLVTVGFGGEGLAIEAQIVDSIPGLDAAAFCGCQALDL